MPYQFDVKEIDFLHAWALNVLIGITVKGNGISYSDEKK
jgi:hypothetical protein